MRDLAETYQYIADILSFKTTGKKLESTLDNPSFDWDSIVKVGSKHLVLPAIYCRLNERNLHHMLPDELNLYLKEITGLNRARNRSILEQIEFLSQLFNSHKINHVFLKGAALLYTNIFDNKASRMIGDIDILVEPKQLGVAFELLQNHNYEPIEQTFGNEFFEHKHLPRLKTNNHICAVELHRKLFLTYKDEVLTNSNILKHKRQINNVFTPSLKHLLRHNVLNYQINDQGSLYNSISFRSGYDTICLLKNNSSALIEINDRTCRSYYRIFGIFFEDIGSKTSLRSNLTTSFYLFKLKHIRFYKIWNKILKYVHYLAVISSRIPHIITNKNYRKALFNDRKRVFGQFLTFLKNS